MQRFRTFAASIAVACLTAACTGSDRGQAAEGAACETSTVQPPADVGAWADDAPVVGSGPLWAVIPHSDWVDAYETDGPIEYRLKLGWFRQEPGLLRIRVAQIDGKGTGTAEVPSSGYGDTGFIPTLIRFSGPGCWQVTGQMDGAEVPVYVTIQ